MHLACFKVQHTHCHGRHSRIVDTFLSILTWGWWPDARGPRAQPDSHRCKRTLSCHRADLSRRIIMHQPSRCIKVHLHVGIQTPNPGWSIKQSFFPQSWFGGKMMAKFKKMFLEEFLGITCDGQRGFCRVKSVARWVAMHFLDRPPMYFGLHAHGFWKMLPLGDCVWLHCNSCNASNT